MCIRDRLNDGELADNGKVAFPQGTRKEWETVLSGFKDGARNEADMECFRKIKELVMPKDLEVIGIYLSLIHIFKSSNWAAFSVSMARKKQGLCRPCTSASA